MNAKAVRIIKNEIEELLEDLVTTPLTSTYLIFYKEEKGVRYFIDCEVAITDYDHYLSLLKSSVEREQFIVAVAEAKAQGYVFEYYNITYGGEEIEAVTLKELLFTLYEMLDPSHSDEIILIQAYASIRGYTPYKIAQALRITRQALHSMLTGLRPFPRQRLEQIIELLDIDIKDFERQKSNYRFKD